MGQAESPGKRAAGAAPITVMPRRDRGIHGGGRVVAGMDPAIKSRGDGEGEDGPPPLFKGDDFPHTDIRAALTI